MSPLDRRRFLIQSGNSLAGVLVAGSLAEQLFLGSGARAASPEGGPSSGFPGSLPDDLASIVADLERKFPYASALFMSQAGVTISRDRTGKRVSEAGFPSRGVMLRVFDGGAFHEAAVGSTSRDELRAAAKRLVRDVPLGKARFKIARLSPLTRDWRTPMERDPAALPLADRVAMVEKEYERVNLDDPRVRSTRVSTDVSEARRIFVDRTRRLSSVRNMVAHNVVLFGFDKGKPGFGFSRRNAQGGLELAALTDAAVERIRKDFTESFGAEPMPAGEYDVVLAPAISGLLAHESFGHGVEMDQFVKDRAKAREFLGKPVASKIVTMLDDPSVAGARGSYPFDDEGVVAAPTTILENGIFVRPLTDLMSATWLGTERTPNGRSQGWDRKVYARMSNTFFARGSSAPAELFESLKDGMYLEGFRNGIEDPQGWGIQFTANTAREVKGGKFTGRIFSPVTVTGYVPEILSNITMIANDFELEPGTCGKGHKEYVPVTSGGPHIRTRARCS
ncbi:MAG: TldD/PmbA family protein [Candidatus Eisenbacteria bacterium]